MKKTIKELKYEISVPKCAESQGEMLIMPVLDIIIRIGSDGYIHRTMDLDALLPGLYPDYYEDFAISDSFYDYEMSLMERIHVVDAIVSECGVADMIDGIADLVYMDWAAELSETVVYENLLESVLTDGYITIHNTGCDCDADC